MMSVPGRKNDPSCPDPSAGPSDGVAAVPAQVVVAALAGMAAAWIAAGSAGMLAYPMRHALCWLALAVSIVAVWSARPGGWRELLGTAVAGLAAVIMSASDLAVVNVMGVVVVLAVLAWVQDGIGGRVLSITAFAAASLGVFRLGCDSIPTVWLAADGSGYLLGRLAGVILGKPL